MRPFRAKGIVILAIAGLVTPRAGIAQPQVTGFTLHGVVRDARGKTVAGAKVSVQSGDPGEIRTVVTDEQGEYSFSVAAGIYSVRATKQGYAAATAGPMSVGNGQLNAVDLTLGVIESSPAFYDQPQFTVSGVTDTTNLGGHGSDTVVRTRDALAKETAGLTKNETPVPPGNLASTEQSLRSQADRAPDNFDANRGLGRFLLENGRAMEALPYLERAQKLKPDDYDTQFAVALATAGTTNLERAKEQAQSLLQSNDKAEVHHLLADVDEKLGDPLEALRHYQRAAQLTPSEPYLFDWGSELLLHHAPEPALDVLGRGHKLFPQSVRMLMGMGASSFALGNYDQAVESVCRASDLAPGNSFPYIFLGKMDRVGSISSAALAERLRRFAQRHPESAEANYYYAVALWKRRGSSQDHKLRIEVESLLKNAIRSDPKFAAGFLQLGILYSEERDFQKAIGEYNQAIQSDSREAEAHYRLAQAYRQVGQPEKARMETDLYERLAKESAVRAENERREMRQFVYTLRDPENTSVH